MKQRHTTYTELVSQANGFHIRTLMIFISDASLRDEVVAIVEKSTRTTEDRDRMFAERRPFLEKVLAAVEAQEGPKGLEIRLRD